jgi:hypothetical protein
MRSLTFHKDLFAVHEGAATPEQLAEKLHFAQASPKAAIQMNDLR